MTSSIKVRERILKSGDTTLVKNYENWIKEQITQEGAAYVVLNAGQYLSDVMGGILNAKKV